MKLRATVSDLQNPDRSHELRDGGVLLQHAPIKQCFPRRNIYRVKKGEFCKKKSSIVLFVRVLSEHCGRACDCTQNANSITIMASCRQFRAKQSQKLRDTGLACRWDHIDHCARRAQA